MLRRTALAVLALLHLASGASAQAPENVGTGRASGIALDSISEMPDVTATIPDGAPTTTDQQSFNLFLYSRNAEDMTTACTVGQTLVADGAGDLDCGAGGGGGTSILLDLADDGANESTAITEIATSAASAIFTEPASNKLLIDMGQPWPSASDLACTDCIGGAEINESALAAVPTATALAANGGNCSSGQAPLGVNASGAAESCFDVVTQSEARPASLAATLTSSTNGTLERIFTVATPSIDNAPGIADGAGADPNPFPGVRASEILSGVWGSAFTNAIDYIHCISGFNGGCGKGTVDNDLYQGGLLIEYSYDQGLRSGAEAMEMYWSVTPATHVVSIDGSGGGAIALGDNVTFSDGAVCRPAQADANLSNGAVIRMTCVDDDPPGVAATISSGCSGCTGAVTGAVADVVYRPWEVTWDTGGHLVRHAFRVAHNGTRAMTGAYFDGANLVSHLGWRGPFSGESATDALRVSIPAFATHSTSLPSWEGDIAVDTTNEATSGGTLVFHDGTAARALSATQTDCFRVDGLDGTDDLVIPHAWYQPVAVVAMGCHNDDADPATDATLTLETLGGTAIDLAGTLTCAAHTAAMAWQTTSDADRVLASGAMLRFDNVVAPTTATDDHTICIAFQATQ